VIVETGDLDADLDLDLRGELDLEDAEDEEEPLGDLDPAGECDADLGSFLGEGDLESGVFDLAGEFDPDLDPPGDFDPDFDLDLPGDFDSDLDLTGDLEAPDLEDPLELELDPEFRLDLILGAVDATDERTDC